jgi:hypothetical protein
LHKSSDFDKRGLYTFKVKLNHKAKSQSEKKKNLHLVLIATKLKKVLMAPNKEFGAKYFKINK